MSITLNRRALLSGGILATGLLASPSRLLAAAGRGFTHSVASGDPVQTEVTSWTRYVSPDPTRLRVEAADDPRFDRIAARGEAIASPGADHCAKVRVTGLKPGRRFHYRFIAPGGERSEVGRTRTLPEGKLDRFRIAVVSCANATSGWSNAYAHVAARDYVDPVVHLGDYIYESPIDRSDAIKILARSRNVLPAAETVALAHYRARYASYRADRDLAEMHRLHPMIVVGDDHETANNAWIGGASGHQPAEGPRDARKAAGMRAYDAYRIGDLATLFRLETRLIGRDRQLDIREVLAGQTDPRAAIGTFRTGPLADAGRSMMGVAQEKWLADGLAASVGAGTP